MQDLGGILYLLLALVVGIALCWLGDIIRRRTAGRIRHAEIHLFAWIPTLLAEGAILWDSRPAPLLIYLFPLIFAGTVYGMWFAKISGHRRAWEQSEQYLDKLDAQVLKDKRRRERIESYKHKGKIPRDGQP